MFTPEEISHLVFSHRRRKEVTCSPRWKEGSHLFTQEDGSQLVTLEEGSQLVTKDFFVFFLSTGARAPIINTNVITRGSACRSVILSVHVLPSPLRKRSQLYSLPTVFLYALFLDRVLRRGARTEEENLLCPRFPGNNAVYTQLRILPHTICDSLCCITSTKNLPLHNDDRWENTYLHRRVSVFSLFSISGGVYSFPLKGCCP